jgi:galactokinase
MRKDNSLRFFAADYGERKRTSITNLKYKREDRWANQIKGILWVLMKAGYPVHGYDFTVTSTIPQEQGLGSSAAMGVATIYALKMLGELPFSKIDAVNFVHQAETVFNGFEKTATDLYGSMFSKKGHALFFDARNNSYELVPVHLKSYKMLITLAGVPIVPVGTELEQKKEAFESCVGLLNERKPGTTLRDYTLDDMQYCMGKVSENERRICMHVVGENQRVREAKTALLKKDIVQYGRLLSRSQQSLRDNYELSCPEVDWLVKRASELDGVLGARLIGKGFGSGTVTLMGKEAIEPYKGRLEEYEHIFGFPPQTFFYEPATGVQITYQARKRRKK